MNRLLADLLLQIIGNLLLDALQHFLAFVAALAIALRLLGRFCLPLSHSPRVVGPGQLGHRRRADAGVVYEHLLHLTMAQAMTQVR